MTNVAPVEEISQVRLDPVAEYNLKAQNYDQSVNESVELLASNGGITLITSSPSREPPSPSASSPRHSESHAGSQQAPPSALESTSTESPAKRSDDRRCHFTKARIGKTDQYYEAREGLTLKGDRILMRASAMKLKGCPTISDEDIKRAKGAYPDEFSCLPRELAYSNGWLRISKYCHFSNRPIPDGVPFFYSKRRYHPKTSGFYYLIASAVGMTRPDDIKPLGVDDLVVLLADYPAQCDTAPADLADLIQDPSQWSLVGKFCFFSGGPIKAEDTYYWADLNGNKIYMLVVLSPNLTPNELYRVGPKNAGGGAMSVEAVEEVEKVYDLTEKDFTSLSLKHQGRFQILPPRLHKPDAWTKVMPPEMAVAKEEALRRAELDYALQLAPPTRPSKASKSISHINESATSILERAKLGLICGSPSFDESILSNDQDYTFLFDDQSTLGEDTLDSVSNAKDILRRYAQEQGISVEELLVEDVTTAESTVNNSLAHYATDEDDDSYDDLTMVTFGTTIGKSRGGGN